MATHVNDLPVVGDTITGVITAVVGAHTATDDDGNEVTRARYEVELADNLVLDVETESGEAKKLQAEKESEKEPKKVPVKETEKEKPVRVTTPLKK